MEASGISKTGFRGRSLPEAFPGPEFEMDFPVFLRLEFEIEGKRSVNVHRTLTIEAFRQRFLHRSRRWKASFGASRTGNGDGRHPPPFPRLQPWNPPRRVGF